MVLIDAYPAGEYFFQNVGVDDYSGGYQIGSYLCSCGFDKALFLAETDIDSDYSRWMGFKQAMEKEGKFCSRTRLIVIPGERNRRIQKYKELLPRFLQVKAVAFSSDYAAIEAMNFLSDHGIKVPEQVSVTGFDDSIYARMVRPRLTTVHQDVGQKAHLAFSRLLPTFFKVSCFASFACLTNALYFSYQFNGTGLYLWLLPLSFKSLYNNCTIPSYCKDSE